MTKRITLYSNRTYQRPDRVLELKQRCIDRRHRQSVDTGGINLECQESRVNNDMLLANYQSTDFDFISKEEIPVSLGFLIISTNHK